MITIFNKKKLLKCKNISDLKNIEKLLNFNKIEISVKRKGISVLKRYATSIDEIVWFNIYVKKKDFSKARELIDHFSTRGQT